MWRSVLLATWMVLLSSAVHAQVKTIDTLSIACHDAPLEVILDSISSKTNYFFSYNADALKKERVYSVSMRSVHIEELLDSLLSESKLDYTIIDDQVILKMPDRNRWFAKKASKEFGVVQGRVLVESDEQFLSGANVFIDGTTIGAVTGEQGAYALREIPVGVHQLVFSHIGYLSESYTVRILPGSVQVLNTLLKEDPRLLDSVEVTSRPYVDAKVWQRSFREFEKEFIGGSENASGTTITNKDVLDFAYDSERDLLEAFADHPLEVRNDALGYKLVCQLEYFRKEKEITTFHIKAQFQEMIPSGRREKRKWKKNREAAYEGSSMHFFKSLVKGNPGSAGFRLYSASDGSELKQIQREDIICAGNSGVFWKLCFEGQVYVHYIHEREPYEYLTHIAGVDDRKALPPGRNPGQQVSVLELKEREVVLYNNGQVQKPAHVLKKGYWSWERVADLMPIDYRLKDK